VLINEITSVLNDSEKLKQMSNSSRSLGKPDAAKKVADLAVSLVLDFNRRER
jgi:UDP-N-acetylglucosamine:LPS N-acetylglucosamine transferase